MTSLMDFAKKHRKEIDERKTNLDVMEKIWEIMDRKKINQSQLAEKMKLSKSQVSRLLSDERNLTLSSVAKIFSALGEQPCIVTKSEMNLQKEKNAALSLPSMVATVKQFTIATNPRPGWKYPSSSKVVLREKIR